MTVAPTPQRTLRSQASARLEEVSQDGLRRWTAAEYHRLIEAGFFGDGRVELLEGSVWDMSGQTPLYATGIRPAQLCLRGVFAGAFEVRPQMPVTLPDGVEPEPDVSVVPAVPGDSADHHPGPDEPLLAMAGLYTDTPIYQTGQSVAPLRAPDKLIAVADLLPQRRTR